MIRNGSRSSCLEPCKCVRLPLRQVALEAEAKRYLTRLIETSPDAIISTDKDGNVVLFSEGAETLLGYRAKEVTGRSILGTLRR